MTDQPVNHERKIVLSDGVWTVVERVISQFCQLAIFITAARILLPEEFGVFALTSACAILLLRFAEVGWAQYILAWSGSDTVPRQVLFVAILFGLSAALVGCLAGIVVLMSNYAHEIGILVILFSIWILLATISSSQKGILIWQSKLRASAWCEISGELAGLLVAIASLFAGFGVLALVFGRIAMQSVHLILSFAFTRLTPLRGMSGAQLRDLRDFSIPLFSSRMIANIRLYAATFIIGGFLGAAAVGYYRAAERLVGALTEVVAVPSQIFAWSLFRKAREKHGGSLAGFQNQANAYFHVLFLTALPIFVWVSVFASDLIVGLIGQEWLPAVPVVMILALSQVAKLPSFATEAVLSLAGEIKRMPKFAAFFLVVTVALNFAASPFGMLAVASVQVVGAVIVTIALLWLTTKYGDIRWSLVAASSKNIVIPVVLASLTLSQMRGHSAFADMAPLLRVCVASLPALLVYFVALCVFDPVVRQAVNQKFGKGT